MKISDLNKIDIKDLKKIDLPKLREQILAKPDMAVNVVLVILTLVIMFNIYNSKQGELKKLKSQTLILEKKSEAINRQKAQQSELDGFLTSLPAGITADSIIDKITEFAGNRGIQILSFSPAKQDTKPLFSRTSVEFTVITDDYKSMALLIRDIEKSPYALRIEKWVGSIVETEARVGVKGRKEGETIIAQIEVGSINFKK